MATRKGTGGTVRSHFTPTGTEGVKPWRGSGALGESVGVQNGSATCKQTDAPLRLSSSTLSLVCPRPTRTHVHRRADGNLYIWEQPRAEHGPGVQAPCMPLGLPAGLESCQAAPPAWWEHAPLPAPPPPHTQCLGAGDRGDCRVLQWDTLQPRREVRPHTRLYRP